MTFEKSVKHNEQNRLSMWLAAVVVGILIVVILVACAGLVRRLHSNNERIAELNGEIVQSSRCSPLDYMCKFLVSGMGRVRKVSAVLPVVLPPSGRFF